MICLFVIRPRVARAEDIASKSAILCDSALNESRTAISNCISYLAFRDVLESEQSQSSNDSSDSPDDVIGILGYGQSHNDRSVWIYRDDLLRDGRSRRVFLKRIPKTTTKINQQEFKKNAS